MIKRLFALALLALVGLAAAAEIYEENNNKPLFAAYTLASNATPYDKRRAIVSVKVWEDGTIVYSEDITTPRKVWINKLQQVDALSVQKEFMLQFPTLTGSSRNNEGICLQFWVPDNVTTTKNPKTVCICDRCQNPPFSSLRNLVLGLKSKLRAGTSTEFSPRVGWLVDEYIPYPASSYATWPNGPAFSDKAYCLPSATGTYLSDAWNAMNSKVSIRRTSGPFTYSKITVQVAGISVIDPPTQSSPTPTGSSTGGGGNNDNPAPTPYTYRNPAPPAWAWIVIGLGLFFLIALCGIIARVMRKRRQAAMLGNAYEFQVHDEEGNDAFPGYNNDDNSGNSIQMQSWGSTTASAPTATNVPSYAQTSQMPVYMGTNQYGQPVMYTVVPASYTMTQAPVYVQPQDAMQTYAYYVPTATNQ